MKPSYWSRPWNDGAREHYEEHRDDQPPLCECEDPECEGCEPLDEDRLIDQVMEDQLSPPIEE